MPNPANEIQVFIKGCKSQHMCAKLLRGSTVKDLKRIVKVRFGIPLFEQRIRYGSRILYDKQVLTSEYNDRTLDLSISLLSGPNEGNPDLWDVIVCSVVLDDNISTITLKVKPYWQIGGSRGVISRILEQLDEIKPHNYLCNDVQLLYNGKPMNLYHEISQYSDLTREYITKEDVRNPYGCVISLKGTSPKRKKRLVLELKPKIVVKK